MVRSISHSHSFSNFVEIKVSPTGQLKLAVQGQVFQVKFLGDKEISATALDRKQIRKIENFFAHVFQTNPIDFSQAKIKNLKVKIDSSDTAKITIVQKNKVSKVCSENTILMRDAPFKRLFDTSSALTPKGVTVMQMRNITPKTYLSLIFKTLKELFRPFLSQKHYSERRMISEFQEMISALPLRMQRSVLRRLSHRVTEEERYIAHYLKDRIDWRGLDQQKILFQILSGAYVMIEDEGETYDNWVDQLDNKHARLSSHESNAQQYAVRGPIASECLFSKKSTLINGAKKEVSWFQLERYPAKVGYHIRHIWTWILYKMTGKNQGPFGESIHREGSDPICLRLRSPRSIP